MECEILMPVRTLVRIESNLRTFELKPRQSAPAKRCLPSIAWLTASPASLFEPAMLITTLADELLEGPLTVLVEWALEMRREARRLAVRQLA